MSLFYYFLLSLFYLYGSFSQEIFKGNKLLMIIFDGLVHDFQTLTDLTPNFDEIAKNGVKAERMIPPYPPDTWPSMTTLSTGLYTESHGIISNSFYDTDSKIVFKYSDDPENYEINGRFFKQEPLWLTNQKLGGSFSSR